MKNDLPIGTLWGNHETLEWYQKRATEWHFIGVLQTPYEHLRLKECTDKCLKIEDDMAFWNNDLFEENKKLKAENEDLRRRIDNYRGAQDINSKLADARIADMNALESEIKELKQEITRLQRLNETGGKLSSSDGWPRVHQLENENRALYNQLEVANKKYVNDKGIPHSVQSHYYEQEISKLLKEREELYRQLVEANDNNQILKRQRDSFSKGLAKETIKTSKMQTGDALNEFGKEDIIKEYYAKILQLKEQNEQLKHSKIMAEAPCKEGKIDASYFKTTVERLYRDRQACEKKLIESQEQVMRYRQTVEEKDKEINKLKQGLLDVKFCWICGRSYNTLKEHDCNLNNEVSNKNKLISDLRSQLKQLGAKYKNLQKEMALLVERNKGLATSFVGNKIRQDSHKCKYGYSYCICPDGEKRTK